MKLILLPLESLKERYSSWWQHYIPERLKQIGVPFIEVDGESLTQDVNAGTVLDANGTNYWKASQLRQVCKMFKNKEIKDGDKFFVYDIWFPGIEMIPYMAELNNIKVDIYGLWFAGSIARGDFVEPMHDWAKFFELGFLRICTKMFTATEYSKQCVINRLLMPYISQYELNILQKRIIATGLPVWLNYMKEVKEKFDLPRKNILLYPNRFDIEKGPNTYMDIIEILLTKHESKLPIDFKTVICTSRKKFTSNRQWLIDRLNALQELFAEKIVIQEDLSKFAYYSLLCESKLMLSTTIEENFGYCQIEAAACGCIPIVPNAFSAPEIFENDRRFLYNDIDEAIEKIMKYINSKDINIQYEQDLYGYIEPYKHVVDNWVKEMLE